MHSCWLIFISIYNTSETCFWRALDGYPGPEVIIQVLFTSEQPKRNKMASSFPSISENEIPSLNEEAVPKNTKMATKFDVTVFNSKLFNLSSLIF